MRKGSNTLSSMMSVFTLLQRSRTSVFLKPMSLPATFLAGSFPIPMPAQECNVQPPMLIAAMPVEAVIPSVGQGC
ncbi:hypothetical protein C8R47DRAFT_969824 [Mycena vitilis]|nr:hypothetical protein C8R47DRAFT_969824 [Mycena vitilis]